MLEKRSEVKKNLWIFVSMLFVAVICVLFNLSFGLSTIISISLGTLLGILSSLLDTDPKTLIGVYAHVIVCFLGFSLVLSNAMFPPFLSYFSIYVISSLSACVFVLAFKALYKEK